MFNPNGTVHLFPDLFFVSDPRNAYLCVGVDCIGVAGAVSPGLKGLRGQMKPDYCCNLSLKQQPGGPFPYSRVNDTLARLLYPCLEVMRKALIPKEFKKKQFPSF